MRALLLAAGLGTRLRPMTDTTPKCLVPVGNKALLQIWLERLTGAGFGPFLINTHYLAEQVHEFIQSSPYRNQVTLVHEPKLLGTAGTLIRNLDFFQGEDALIIHADNYCLADFRAFKQAHEKRPAACLMTMMTFQTDEPQSCGIVEVDDNGVVTGFHEKVKNPPGNLANGAIYILSKQMLELISREMSDASDISKEIIPRMMGRIHVYRTTEIFADIGSIPSYENLRNKISLISQSRT